MSAATDISKSLIVLLNESCQVPSSRALNIIRLLQEHQNIKVEQILSLLYSYWMTQSRRDKFNTCYSEAGEAVVKKFARKFGQFERNLNDYEAMLNDEKLSADNLGSDLTKYQGNFDESAR